MQSSIKDTLKISEDLRFGTLCPTITRNTSPKPVVKHRRSPVCSLASKTLLIHSHKLPRPQVPSQRNFRRAKNQSVDIRSLISKSCVPVLEVSYIASDSLLLLTKCILSKVFSKSENLYMPQ